MTPYSKAILEAIGFFSYFSLSPTALEVWKILPHRPRDYAQFLGELEDLTLQGLLRIDSGHFALVNSNNATFERRKLAFLDAMKKQKRWKKVIGVLRFFPGIEGIALCNLLPLSFTKSTSDIDIFILAKEGRVWTTRFFVTFFLRLLRLRPGEAKRDPIDASFFVSTSAYDFSPLFLQPKDPYFSFWLRSLLPVYEKKTGIFKTFFEANAFVDYAIIPELSTPQTHPFQFPTFGEIGETFFKRIQLRIMPVTLRTRMNQSTDIVVNDALLKFHQNDRRKLIADYVQHIHI